MTKHLAAIALLLAALPCTAPAQPLPLTQTEQASGTQARLIAVSPVSDRVVWVSGANGTWARTRDGGASWQAGQVPGAEKLEFRDVHAVSADKAWLLSIGPGEQSRIYLTVDGGAHWQQQFVNDQPKAFLDCMDFWDEQHAVVIGDSVDGHVDLLATDDGGTHWTRLPAGARLAAPSGEGSFAASGTCLVARAGGLAWAVVSSPGQARLLATRDQGRSWTAHALPITARAESGPQTVAFRDDRHGITLAGGRTLAAGDVAAAVTDDGGQSWTPRSGPAQAQGVWGAVYVPGSATVVAVGISGAAYSRDEGLSWTALNGNNYWAVAFASAQAGWAVGTGGRITRLSGF
jgi:photosystem II stability/assembly factor-like uncharacterized protein